MENFPNHEAEKSMKEFLSMHQERCIEVFDLSNLGELTPLDNSTDREGCYLGADYVIKTSGKSTTAERTITDQAKNLIKNPNLPIVVSKQYIKTGNGKEYLIEPRGELFKDFYIKNPADMGNKEFGKILDDFMEKWANEFPNDFDDFSLEKHLLVYKEGDQFVLKLTDADLSRGRNIEENQQKEIIENLLKSINEKASEFKKKIDKIRSIRHEIVNTMNEVRILTVTKNEPRKEQTDDINRIIKDLADIAESLDSFCSALDEILEDNDLKRTNEKFLSYKDSLKRSYKEIFDSVRSIDTNNFPDDESISRMIRRVDEFAQDLSKFRKYF